MELRYPNINGASEREQLSQVKSYLHQLVGELQFALSTVEASGASGYVVAQTPKNNAPSSSSNSFNAEVAFDALKPLIIKSADIVQAYYEEVVTRLEGMYVAESDFGTFAEETSQTISQNSTNIEQAFRNIQAIVTSIDNLNYSLVDVSAYIKSGLLYYDKGVPVYGVEIGQENTIDGEKVFNKFARFTADRLSFYDQNDTEVAYVSDYKLYIRNVEIKESLQEGGYKDFIDANGGIVTKWVGGNG